MGIVVVARLCRQSRRISASRYDHLHLTTNQIGRQRRQTFVLSFRPAILDGNVSILDIADFTQALVEGAHELRE